MTAEHFITQLQLQPHPEGGFYKEVYRSKDVISKNCLPQIFGGERHYSTAIYYLLQREDFSAFHRIKSDEQWHFYAGGSLLLHLINEAGDYQRSTLGADLLKGENFQVLMPAGVWFAAEPAPGTDFTLAGCTVSPGFDFNDFEMAAKENLLEQFPAHREIINRLCR